MKGPFARHAISFFIPSNGTSIIINLYSIQVSTQFQFFDVFVQQAYMPATYLSVSSHGNREQRRQERPGDKCFPWRPQPTIIPKILSVLRGTTVALTHLKIEQEIRKTLTLVLAETKLEWQITISLPDHLSVWTISWYAFLSLNSIRAKSDYTVGILRD